MSPQKRLKRGFTILEATVAVFVLLLGVLFIFGMFPAGADAVTTARDTYSASELAHQKLEYWIQQGYSTIAASTLSQSLEAAHTVTITDRSNGATQTWNFQCQITHQPVCTALCSNAVNVISETYPNVCPAGYTVITPSSTNNLCQTPAYYTDIAEQVEAYISWRPKGWLFSNVEFVRLDTMVIQGWQTP